MDVDCGRWGKGREALKAYYGSTNVLTGFYRCVHLICGQTIDLVDADHATGTVYCRAGHEDKDHWVEMAICYFDRYVRSEGRWCFERREEKHWYSTDWQQRPHGPALPELARQVRRPELPAAAAAGLAQLAALLGGGRRRSSRQRHPRPERR